MRFIFHLDLINCCFASSVINMLENVFGQNLQICTRFDQVYRSPTFFGKKGKPECSIFVTTKVKLENKRELRTKKFLILTSSPLVSVI